MSFNLKRGANVNVIEYLSRIQRYDVLSKQLQEIITDLDEKLLYNFLSELTKEKILAYQKAYRIKIQKYEIEKEKIVSQINYMPVSLQRQVLFYKYVSNIELKDISKLLTYSEQYIRYICSISHKEFSRLYLERGLK